MIEKVIDGKEGNPTILKDKVSLAPTVGSVKFDLKGHAEDFVRRHSGNETNFPYKFDDFWCNMNQTPEERATFHQKMRPLFKMKRAI